MRNVQTSKKLSPCEEKTLEIGNVKDLFYQRDIYISGKSKVYAKRHNSAGAYKSPFSWFDLVHGGTTFYGASIGEVRFGGTFRIPELQSVGLWSDFEILAENFKKIYVWTRF